MEGVRAVPWRRMWWRLGRRAARVARSRGETARPYGRPGRPRLRAIGRTEPIIRPLGELLA